MAFLESAGYDGPITEEQWATMNALATRYSVETQEAWRVKAIGGDRSVTIAAGRGLGCGVLSTTDSAAVLDIPAPAAGRWYLIACRRNWATNSEEFVVVAGETTPDAQQTVRPTLFPAAMKSDPGVLDDQPLAWVHARSASTSLTVLDIRDTPFWIDYEPKEASASWTYQPESYIRRRGNEVHCHIRVSRSGPINAEQTVLNLPYDITPFDDHSWAGSLVSGAARGICTFSISRSAELNLLYRSNNQATQARLEFSYLLS